MYTRGVWERVGGNDKNGQAGLTRMADRDRKMDIKEEWTEWTRMDRMEKNGRTWQDGQGTKTTKKNKESK